MNILGNRVYLNLPEMPERELTISPELKKELEEERLKQFDKLEVYAFGEDVHKMGKLKVRDNVLVDQSGLRRGIFLEIEGQKKICVSYFDIMHIW